MTVGYIRSAEALPSSERQHELLSRKGCQRFYREDDGMLSAFSQLHAMVDEIQAADVVVVTELAVIASSIKELDTNLSALTDKGIVFMSLAVNAIEKHRAAERGAK